MRTIARWLARHVQGALYRHLLRCADHRIVFEIPVAVVSDSSPDLRFEKISIALDLLSKYAPAALSRLRRDAEGILVFATTSGVAAWNNDVKLIILDKRFVDDPQTPAVEVASTLVHEATHARLDRLGFRYDPERRARIEAVCFRRELAFACRLPEPGALIADTERQLERDSSCWSDEAFRQRVVAALGDLGVPRWLARTIEWISRPRAA